MVKPQHTLITLSMFQDPASGQPLQKSRIIGLPQERNPRRQKASRTKGIPRWNLFTIINTCFIYLYTARPWIGHVKQSYLPLLDAFIVNIHLDVLYINGRLYTASAYYSYLHIFSINVYLLLHPYTLVRLVCQGLLMAPHNTTR